MPVLPGFVLETGTEVGEAEVIEVGLRLVVGVLVGVVVLGVLVGVVDVGVVLDVEVVASVVDAILVVLASEIATGLVVEVVTRSDILVVSCRLTSSICGIGTD